MSEVETIAEQGDAIERYVFSSGHFDELNQVLIPYAEVWHQHVYPRRDPNNAGFLAPAWVTYMNFAGSHYTALVRFFNAWEASERVQALCMECNETNMGKFLLQLQDATTSIFWNLGSAVDNLADCLKIPGSTLKGIAKDDLAAAVPGIETPYDFRSVMIHNRLVPIGVKEGRPYFRKKFMDAGGDNPKDLRPVPKNVNWKLELTDDDFVDIRYATLWRESYAAMAKAWCYVRNGLRKYDPNPPAAQTFVTIPPEGETISNSKFETELSPKKAGPTGPLPGGSGIS